MWKRAKRCPTKSGWTCERSVKSCLLHKQFSEITSAAVNSRWKKAGLTFATIVVLSSCCAHITAQNNLRGATDNQLGSLADIRLTDKALLVVLKSSVVFADETDRSIIDLVLKADSEPSPRHQLVYGMLAKRLNKYIRRYKTLSAAEHLSEADLVIFFSLIEYRQILNVTYPFGELFIIVKGEPKARRPPRIVWKSRRVLWAGDAINDFLKDLKNTRGEP